MRSDRVAVFAHIRLKGDVTGELNDRLENMDKANGLP